MTSIDRRGTDLNLQLLLRGIECFARTPQRRAILWYDAKHDSGSSGLIRDP